MAFDRAAVVVGDRVGERRDAAEARRRGVGQLAVRPGGDLALLGAAVLLAMVSASPLGRPSTLMSTAVACGVVAASSEATGCASGTVTLTVAVAVPPAPSSIL